MQKSEFKKFHLRLTKQAKKLDRVYKTAKTPDEFIERSVKIGSSLEMAREVALLLFGPRFGSLVKCLDSTGEEIKLKTDNVAHPKHYNTGKIEVI